MSNLENIVIRDQRRQGWFSVDNEILDEYAGQIGAYGVAVYCAICRHSRNQVAKLSQRDIAASLAISHDRVGKSLKALSDLALIFVEVPARPGPGLISTITLLNVKSTGRHTASPIGELDVTRPRNKEEKTKTKTETKLPPTPLFEGGVSTIWQQVCEYLKDDLSSAYVHNQRFQECTYDKYFRDAWLVEIRGGIAILDSRQPDVLREGVERHQKRLRETFRGVVADIYAVRVNESQQLNLEASA